MKIMLYNTKTGWSKEYSNVLNAMRAALRCKDIVLSLTCRGE